VIRVDQPEFPVFGTEMLVNATHLISEMSLFQNIIILGLNLNKTLHLNAGKSHLMKKFPEH